MRVPPGFHPPSPREILLVEDDPSEARLIQDMVSSGGSTAVSLTRRAILGDAKRFLEVAHPEIILVDLNLPDAHGMEAIHGLRQVAPQIPLVALTSLDDPRVAKLALQEGAQDCLVKGRFDAEMLRRSIRHALERAGRESDLLAGEARLRRMLEACLIGIVLVDADGRILECNQAFTDLLGLAPPAAGRPSARWDEGVVAEDRPRHRCALQAILTGRTHPPWEVTVERAVGGPVPVLLGAAPLEDPPGGLVAYAMDIRERKEHLERLQREARQDPLTGLRNRRGFLEALKPSMASAERYGYPLCLASGDLDGFKQVNDTYGHGAGDAVLRAFSGLVLASIRGEDLAARLGGDEFCILYSHTPAHIARHNLERICSAFRGMAFQDSKGQSFHCTASFGLVDLPHGAKSLEAFLQRADEALYAAKRLGRDRIEVDAAGL